MLIGIAGDLGAGKTVTAVYIAIKYALEGKKVYTNFDLSPLIPHTRIWAIRHMEKMHDGVFIADELWTWLDCRYSTREQNKGSSLMLAKSRKRGFDVVWTAQLIGTLDLRPRRLTQKFLYPKMLPSPENPRKCYVQMTDRKSKPCGSFTFDPRKYFPMYDTNEEVALPAEFYEDTLRKMTRKQVKLDKEEYFDLVTGKREIEDLAIEYGS